ncbi:monovalent cation/H(+) antiporter subunit G [Bordetella genomosp. 13]|uniref:Cation:proton antiporter n=1 Tax=Bordetella genomosp. 13 TaxID=463040 RepID=A0A1W6ZDG8_9BORD|nr:monovalent cation/H(+) antiporter subunit G [Bordetella genomosp. 13]ARP95426.1 cation:proton antiporter [Bordetella genomosp. 13]
MMNDIPMWAAVPAAILLVLSGVLALTGSIGLLRFRTFYMRIHAPTLGSTLGLGCMLGASVLVFSAQAGRPIFHEIAIALLLMLTSPITAMLLMRAAAYRARRRQAGALEQTEPPRN